MFTCPVCSRSISHGGICKKCGSLFCENESICSRCNVKLEPINIKNEVIRNNSIDWIEYKDKTIGLAKYNTFPRELIDIWDFLDIEDGFRVILFRTKQDSTEFIKSVYSDNLDVLDTLPFNEKSRYTVIRLPDNPDDKFVLLNMSVININSIAFILNMFFKMNKSGNLLEIRYDENVVTSFAEILYKYNNKIGLPFVSVMEGNMTAIDSVLKNMNMNYEEFSSLKQLSNDIARLSDYLLYKIEMYFDLIYNLKINTFLDLLSFVNSLVYIHSIKSIAREFGDVYNEISNLIDILHTKLINNNILKEDLLNIVSFILKYEDVTFDSYSAYSTYVLNLYSKSIDLIENYYKLPEETLEIFRVAHKYLQGIEEGFPYTHPYLGDVDNYVDLLTRIVLNVNADVIIRLSAGQSLNNILLTLSLYHDYYAYLKLINMTEYYADFIIENIEKINKEMKYIGIHDSARVLTLLLTMSEYNNDDDTYQRIYNKIDDLINEYKLTPYRIILEWKRYMRDGNESHIKEIYKLFSGIDYEYYDYIEPFLMILGYLSNLIIENDDHENYEKALEWNEALFYHDSGFEKINLANYIMYNDIINIIYELKNIIKNNQYHDINKTKKHITSFNDVSGNLELLKHLVYKTEILVYLINDDYDRLINCINILKRLTNTTYIRDYYTDILNWSVDYENKGGRSFILTKYIKNINTIDPWYLVFKKYVIHKMSLDLNNNIIIYDAIIMLEGKTDVVVFREICNNFYPDKNILFKDFGGYTNLTLFYKEMQLIESFNVPIYCIFDGDTYNSKKMRNVIEKLLDDYTNDKIKIYVLNKNTIEDYLIIPRIIKSTFPKIKEGEAQIELLLNSKRNKKKLLNHLFIKNGLNSYSHKSARLIAMNIDDASLDPELLTILNDIFKTD